MVLNHAGVFNRSEEDALGFYKDFLGFDVTKDWVVPAGLTEQLFALSRDIRMMVFEKQGTKIEVFICPECKNPTPDFRHIGIVLDNLPAMTEKAKQAGIELIVGSKDDKSVYFIKDFAGNLIEIKQR